ncbi:pyrroline-5-carboxylate reductase [Variovorax sp. HJSM1_2]|uniref:pyrroline-5-carboxylate reductase n=1 Tax=Variovorax sp. HJSM1_2 TaxID=3366263 RepID=UPI003BE3EC75
MTSTPASNTTSTGSFLAANEKIAFIGGGNMSSAIIGGLLKSGLMPAQVLVVEPWDEARARLLKDFAISAQAQADASLQEASLVVWGVKPQTFHEAAQASAAHTASALHLSVAAGIRSDSIARWLGTERVVRAMPNTPALIGKGMTGLYAGGKVDTQDRTRVEQVLASTGGLLWVDAEAKLDAVTAVSGSGPAYVFYFMESMVQAGVDMGLTPEQAKTLALGTFTGAAELASRSSEPLETLRQRVTSKGGTTYAAISAMEQDEVKRQIVSAVRAAEKRAGELGDEFGKP